MCQIISGNPACSCLPNYIGVPPQCRPECILSSECKSLLACVNQKCADPCPGSCGINAQCHVLNHLPVCTCMEGFTGDPFTQCSIIPPGKRKTMHYEPFCQKLVITTIKTIGFICAVTEPPSIDPCALSPCGANAICDNGECRCLPEYIGNPYEACRPECILNSECARDKTCLKNKCKDPCPGICGQNAQCDVVNHIPVCSCPSGYVGDPFVSCRVQPRGMQGEIYLFFTLIGIVIIIISSVSHRFLKSVCVN